MNSTSTLGRRNFVTVREACRILGVSRQRVHQLIATYKIQTENLGPRTKLILKSELAKIPKKRPNGVRLDYRE